MTSEPWRVFLAAARQEARALRLLPPGTKVTALDLAAALADAQYAEMRSAENERARRHRERVA